MVDTLITDGTLLLRLPGEPDVDAMVAACQDPDIPRWTLVPSPYTREDAVAWVAHARAVAAQGTELHLLVLDARDERLLGSAGLVSLDRVAGVGEIGYWLAREARGRGVMTRAIGLLRDHAADVLGLTAIDILAHRDNATSRRAAERAGFAPTGEERPCPRRDPPGPPDHVVHRWSASP